MRCPSLLALMLLAAGLSGCTDESPVPPADEPAAAVIAEVPVWTNATFEGTYVGVNAVVGAVNPLAPLGDGYGSHNFEVPEGTQRLEISLHLVVPFLEEVMLRLIEPGCATVSCPAQVVTTQGGMATLAVDAPESGTWRTVLFQQTPGPGATPYHLYVGVLA